MTTNDLTHVFAVLRSQMQDAEHDEHEHELVELEAKRKKEAARLKKETLRAAIKTLDPYFDFGPTSNEKILPVLTSVTAHVVPPEPTQHKKNYGKWAQIAKKVLDAVGGKGTFSELKERARLEGWVQMGASDRELEGLRNALHGLARRERIFYWREEGADGVFSNKPRELSKETAKGAEAPSTM
jgi:hypothetical protein